LSCSNTLLSAFPHPAGTVAGIHVTASKLSPHGMIDSVGHIAFWAMLAAKIPGLMLHRFVLPLKHCSAVVLPYLPCCRCRAVAQCHDTRRKLALAAWRPRSRPQLASRARVISTGATPCIPALRLADGPAGIRTWPLPLPARAGLHLRPSFDRDLAYRYGRPSAWKAARNQDVCCRRWSTLCGYGRPTHLLETFAKITARI